MRETRAWFAGATFGDDARFECATLGSGKPIALGQRPDGKWIVIDGGRVGAGGVTNLRCWPESVKPARYSITFGVRTIPSASGAHHCR